MCNEAAVTAVRSSTGRRRPANSGGSQLYTRAVQEFIETGNPYI